MQRKYGMADNLCGIYKITNKITKECYIGQAVDISARLSTHFGRDAKKYYGKHKFHTDIIDYGRDCFKCEILELCDKDNLLEREEYWYDKIKPSYNIIRPRKYNTQDPITKKHLSETLNSKEFQEKMRPLWDSQEYKEKCRKIHTKGKRKMKECLMLDNNLKIIKEFNSLSAAARYITETTTFKSKNKVSKIKSVCDKERSSAFGYKWKYKEV